MVRIEALINLVHRDTFQVLDQSIVLFIYVLAVLLESVVDLRRINAGFVNIVFQKWDLIVVAKVFY